MKLRKVLVIAMISTILSGGCDGGNAAVKSQSDSGASCDRGLERATFAGGCFWCMEPPFAKLDGVVAVLPGYTGGHDDDPTYEEVSRGDTGHVEAVQIVFDPKKISYRNLVEVFWRQIDPTDNGGQFADRGSQYETAIFYHGEAQKSAAEASKRALGKSGKFKAPIATEIRPFKKYYVAEEYHQQYYKKNPVRYKSYKAGSGREGFIERTWRGDELPAGVKIFSRPSDEALKKKLTPMQYRVTRENETESPFRNEYWDDKREGLYVDVVSGEPLFSSVDKFDSGTGWPSFTRPVENENVVEKKDASLGVERVEIRSKRGDSHLGHVFNDGPAPTRMRYCVNSASLRFIPREDLKKEGYEKYEKLFENNGKK